MFNDSQDLPLKRVHEHHDESKSGDESQYQKNDALHHVLVVYGNVYVLHEVIFTNITKTNHDLIDNMLRALNAFRQVQHGVDAGHAVVQWRLNGRSKSLDYFCRTYP
jgi:hypothetical protein